MDRPASARQRFGRYAAISALSVATGHVLLYGLHSTFGVGAVTSNVLSTLINTALVFVANRRWVWDAKGAVAVRREVGTFTAMAALGLAASTLAVWLVSRTIGDGLWVNTANLGAFGAVWLLRFAVLDGYVYDDVGE